MSAGKTFRIDRRAGREAASRWQAALIERFRAAADTEERAQVLAELDHAHPLTEEAALALYAVQPGLASAFIVRPLPRGRRAEDARLPWSALMGQALGRGDDDLHFALYRMQATADEWQRDTTELIRRLADPGTLCAELERRHPARWRPDLAPHLHRLALERGEHILPYILRHAGELWSRRRRAGFDEMAELAARRSWWPLWGALMRACLDGPGLDRTVRALAADHDRPQDEIGSRLQALAAPLSPAGTATARGTLLREETLLELYQRFPQLLRDPFRDQLQPSAARPLQRLLAAILERQDEDLVDHFATRLAICSGRSGGERLLACAQRVADHLSARAGSADALTQRALRLIGRLGPFPRDLSSLLRRNALARLLFELAADASQTDPAARAALLGSAERHLRSLASNAAVDALEHGFAERASTSLAPLLDAIDRGLPSAARRRALRGLARWPWSAEEASRLASWARARAASRRQRPAAEILELLGRLLDRYPALREGGETLPVHRRTAA